jgi:LysM repeat protein
VLFRSEFVAQITAFNQLASSEIQAGQRLAIPAVYAD